MAVTVGKKVLGLVLAGGLGDGLSILAQERTIAAMPFAGKYRVIDFALSNHVNSGIYDVGVLVQYRPHSLLDHLGIGRPWDLDRLHGGLRVLYPYLGGRDSTWFRGTADAVSQNLPFIEDSGADLLLIVMGDSVYKMNFGEIIREHLDSGATLTMAVRTVPTEEAGRYGIVEVDGQGRVTSFIEKPAEPVSNLASIGIYVFDQRRLADRLRQAGSVDFGREVIPEFVRAGEAKAYQFDGYWRDVGIIESYYQAHMDLLGKSPRFDLWGDRWTIYTPSEERPPGRIGPQAVVEESLICHGCRIEGTVIRSVLSPGVRVGRGAVVRDSVILGDAVIGAGSVIDRVVLDKEVEVGDGCRIGVGEATTPNQVIPSLLHSGLTIAGKRAVIPDGTVIGRNCRIGPGVLPADFGVSDVPSGTVVDSDAALARFDR